MKNSRGLVWGGLLIIFGLLWLLHNLDLLDFQWGAILPYWPVLLILAGAVLLATGREHGSSGASGGLVGLLITLAVFGGIINRTDRAFDRHGDDWNFNWNDNDDEDNHDDESSYNDDEEKDEDYEREHLKKNENRPVNGFYKYEMEDFIQKANFHLEGGAGSFTMNGNTAKLFEANTKSSIVKFLSNTSINKLDKSATVNLKMEDGNIRIKKGELSNQASIQLNEKPVWNIDLGIGAGNGNFDFSNYKVEKLKVSTGVADMKIRMGSKLAMSNVEIEAGVASVTLEIPKSVGCEMHMDGALNAKDMEDMDKVSNGLYRSPEFEQSANKIIVHFEGGLTSINIKRY